MSPRSKAKKNISDFSPRVQALVAEAMKPGKPAKGLKFVNGKFVGISLKTAPALLIDPETSFYGHKRIVFAGFCAWLLHSEDGRMTKDAIAVETSKRIIAAENSKRLKNVPLHIRPAMYGEAKYRPLFSQIYYPIGGLSALTRAIAGAPSHAKKMKSAEKEIRYLVAMAAVLDFHARNLMLAGKPYGQPNIQKAGRLAGLLIDPTGEPKKGKLSSKERSHTVVHEYLKAHRRALPFLYAAHHVVFDDNSTLLDRLFLGSLKYKDVSAGTRPSKLEEWFAYAKHFTESVLGIMPGGSGKFSPISIGKAIAPPLTELTPQQVKTIKEVLGEKAPSERRLQF